MTPAICPTCQVGTYDEGATALHARIAELTRERDEAQAEVEKLFESARAAWEAECIMRGQRDEALAELAKESECADAAIEWQRRYYEAQATVTQLRVDVRNLVKALRGYHRAADSWPYARWSAEMHAAEAALESVGMAKRK